MEKFWVMVYKDTNQVRAFFPGGGIDISDDDSDWKLYKDAPKYDYITKGKNYLYYNPDTKAYYKSNEGKFEDIRVKRDQLLKDSDYTQLSDSTYPSTQDAWKTYRQQLRDITKGVTDPDTIVFPEEPK